MTHSHTRADNATSTERRPDNGAGPDAGADIPPAAIVYTTFPTQDAARTAAHALLERRLAACVNIIPGMVAVYRWQGATQEEAEVVALVKTRRALVPDVIAALRTLHPYETPALVAIDIVEGSADYLAWLAAGTAPPLG